MRERTMRLVQWIANRGAIEPVSRLLDRAGVTVNGRRPWDIQVHDERFFARVLRSGGLGAGESYMDGWWDCEAIDQLVERVLTADALEPAERSGRLFLALASTRLLNRQRGT